MGISLINRILIKYENDCVEISHLLNEWLSSLESIAFIANDIETINTFLQKYSPQLIYLSIDSLRSSAANNIECDAHAHYLSDELNEGYDAPQPTPTPHKTSCSSSFNKSTLSDDYSASDLDDDENNFHNFYAINESSDGYHHEGHGVQTHHNRHRLFRNSHPRHRHNHHHHHNHNNHNHNKHHHGHHRYGRWNNGKRKHNPFKYHMNGVAEKRDNKIISSNNIYALQIFSSYSEIRILWMEYLMRKSIKYLGIDINIECTSKREIHKLQEMIYSKHCSPHLYHLSLTDFADFILIPNRIRSICIQRWFQSNLSNLYFESQFFPYNLSHDADAKCYLSLNALNKRLNSSDGDPDKRNICAEYESDTDPEEEKEKRIYLNSSSITSIPNTSSQLFQIKMLLNFDVLRNRWIILKQEYEFLLRLRCIQSLTLIHLVMFHQNKINKHANDYYAANKSNLSLSPSNGAKEIKAIYNFPKFDCKWHTNENRAFYVVAPKKCCSNKVFQSVFPPQTKFYSFNPMIRDPKFHCNQKKNDDGDDEEWILTKKLSKISDLFAVGLSNQLQHPY